ncbi:MAG: hypothetical protein WKF80_01280 [Thermomicrobiales bacterium]
MEDEVLEILQRTDRPISFTDHVRRRTNARRRAAMSDRLRRFQFGPRLTAILPLLVAVITAGLGLALRDVSPLLSTILGWTSVASLLILFVPRFRRATQPSVKRWRGRDMTFDPERPDVLRSLRERFGRGRRF